MDSPQQLKETVGCSDDADRRQHPQKLFAAPEDMLHSQHIIRPQDRRLPALTAWRSYVRPVAFATLAIATIGISIYRYETRQGSGPISITTKVPDARTAGSAVQSLPAPNLLKPVTPEEAVKENSERPFVARKDTPASRFVLKTDTADGERALTCLTQAVYYEAATEGPDGGRAVAQVVLNRLRHPGYPATVCGVVYQGSDRPTGCQFTFTCDGSLLRAHVESLWIRSQKIAREALSGHVFAPVGHATHYHADYVLPYWADSLDKTVQIGRHIFYRLRGLVGDSRAFFQHYAGFEPPIPDPRALGVAAPPPSPQQQQLAKVLIGEDNKGVAPEAEKLPIAVSPLMADASAGTLIIGAKTPPEPARKRPRTSSGECPSANEAKQVTRMEANDLHSNATTPTC